MSDTERTGGGPEVDIATALLDGDIPGVVVAVDDGRHRHQLTLTVDETNEMAMALLGAAAFSRHDHDLRGFLRDVAGRGEDDIEGMIGLFAEWRRGAGARPDEGPDGPELPEEARGASLFSVAAQLASELSAAGPGGYGLAQAEASNAVGWTIAIGRPSEPGRPILSRVRLSQRELEACWAFARAAVDAADRGAG